jgi:hypothetical protein
MRLQDIIREVQTLSTSERRELIKMLVDTLAESEINESPRKTRSLMELAGLGVEIWQGIDAQKYVDDLRDEWDHRP